MITVFHMMLISFLRDKITLFWSLLLPIGLLFGFGYYYESEQYLSRLFIGVLSLSLLFWGVSIAFHIYWQRSRGVYKLLKLTPFSITSFIFIMTGSRTILGIGINLIVLFIGKWILNISLTLAELLFMVGSMLLGLLCFTCLGFIIANLANNEAQISIISNIFYLPMIFGSDAFYSLINTPNWVCFLGNLFPFTYFYNFYEQQLGLNNYRLCQL